MHTHIDDSGQDCSISRIPGIMDTTVLSDKYRTSKESVGTYYVKGGKYDGFELSLQKDMESLPKITVLDKDGRTRGYIIKKQNKVSFFRKFWNSIYRWL